MKLIVTGATGFVGTEVIRQDLDNPAVTSIIALTRNPISIPSNAGTTTNASKLQSIILKDWSGSYPEYVKDAIKGAGACIWTLAVTPSKSKGMDFKNVTEICHDYTIEGLKTIAGIANKPFRFIYTSGVTIERDQSKTLLFLSDYRLMRGRVGNAILQFAEQHTPDVQVAITKSGAIDGPGRAGVMNLMLKASFDMFGLMPRVHVSELAAVSIEMCLNGIEKETLWSGDLVEMAQALLVEEDYLR
ncbi:hypothetical protein EAE96_001296 [Botrytis aclada]|nr:hypothetical protein EAE96_001296 [Botrytis aclada]